MSTSTPGAREVRHGGPFLDRWLHTLGQYESLLWVVAIAAAVGDVLTTAYGLQLGLTEGNPIMYAAIAEFGIVGLAASKVVVLTVGAALAMLLFDGDQRVVVPLGLALPWIAVTVSNTFLIVV